jgi:co-chaperonin GroES (HSP10)
MRLRPLNRVLIIEPDPIERHQGLLVLPDRNSEEKISSKATIISVGPDCDKQFKPGQRIAIKRFFDTPSTFKMDGKKYRFIEDHYILGFLEDED